MALNLPGMPIGLHYTPEETGTPDYAGSLLKGLQVANKGIEAFYQPKMMQSQIEKYKADAIKNKMIGALLQKAISGEGIGGVGGNNLGAAVLKGMLGIDPYLQSPQEKQQMQISGAVNQAAQKKNVDTGASDIARESLQDVVSMPKEYMGLFGSTKMAHDRVLAEQGDEEAKERLIKAAVAERLVPEYSGFQLMSQGQRATVPALQHQQEAIRQGWPMLSKHIVGNLTPELQKEVERRHNEAVKQVNKLREGYLSSGGKNRAESSAQIDQATLRNEVPKATAEDKMDAEFFNTTPGMIALARKKGIKSIKAMREFIANNEGQ